VRRDVRTAHAWDQELCELNLEQKERYLVDLARFEMLSPTEQKVRNGVPHKNLAPGN
jgi:hypothetical protein